MFVYYSSSVLFVCVFVASQSYFGRSELQSIFIGILFFSMVCQSIKQSDHEERAVHASRARVSDLIWKQSYIHTTSMGMKISELGQ
jgi:hypothetical protein